MATRDEPWVGTASRGLIGVLVLVAGVVLAFTGRYPGGLYDLVVGLNRWVFRVAAYAALMTDAYPPFRLDLGGGEPGTPAPRPPATGPAGTSAHDDPWRQAQLGRQTSGLRWTGGRVTALVAGSLLTVAALGPLSAGGAGLWVDGTQRDPAGFVSTDARVFTTPTSALLAEPVDVTLDPGTRCCGCNGRSAPSACT